MELSKIILALLVAFAALQFALLPLFRERLKAESRTGKPLRAGFVAMLQHLRKYVITALLVYALLWLLFALIGGNPASAEGINRLLRITDWAGAAFKPFNEWWMRFLTLVTFFVFAALSMRWLSQSFYDRVRQETDRLLNARDNHSSEWKALPSTKEMEEESSSLDRLVSRRDALAPDAYAARDRMDQEIKDQGSLILLMDVLRRIDLTPEYFAGDAGLSSRIRRLISSKGMLSDVKRVGTFVSTASRVLLCISLVSISSPQITQSLALRQTHLEGLKVNVDLKEAQQAHAKVPAAETPSDVEDVKKAEAYAARVYESAVLSSPAWRAPSSPSLEDREAKADWVRISVREQLYSSGTENPQSHSQNDQTNPDELKLATQFSDELSNEGPRTSLGRLFQKHLSHTANTAEKQSLLQAYRNHLKTYSVVDDFLDLQSWAVGEALGGLAELTLPESENQLVKTLLGAVPHFSEDFAKDYFTLTRNRFMASLLQGQSYETAANEVQKETSKLEGTTIAAQTLKDLLGKLDDSQGVIRKKLLTATAQQSDLAPQTVPSDVARLTDALSRRNNETAKTNPELAQYIQSSLSDAPQTYASQFPLAETVHEEGDLKRAARASNFQEVIKDPHTGGVVIGRLPDGSATADMTDVRWSLQDSQITLFAIDSHRQPIDLGIFPAAFVRQALLYASDVRPLVVTVENSTALARRKVLLHPALQNTALGCRFVNADHIVFDRLTPEGQTTEISKIVDQIQVQALLYNAAVTSLQSTYINDGTLSKEALAALAALNSGSVSSPLTALPNSFNQNLVSSMHKCALEQNAESYDRCLHHSMTAISPDSRRSTHVSSQVQELAFSTDTDLHFLQQWENKDGVSPLRMTIQMSVDAKDVWELQGLTPDVQSRVLQRLTPEQTDELNELRRFASLQRLFRMAYSGGLGIHFPIERLATLASSVSKSSATHVAIPLWTTDGTEKLALEKRIARVATELKPSVEYATVEELPNKAKVLEGLDHCVNAIRESPRPDLIGNDDLVKACPILRFLKPGSSSYVELQQLFGQRELRFKLGAADVPDRAICPAVGVY